MNSEVFQHDLPAPREVVAAMKERSNPLAVLASHSRDVILGELRRELRFENLPHLTHLANAILELPLSCLSAHGDAYWLTFHRYGFPIHLPGRNEIPLWLYEAFPIGTVKGLEGFLRYFGGMVYGYLPPQGQFWSPSEAFLVLANEPNCDWGTFGEWQGALSFYHGTSGDQIVIHRDGYPGKWSHEVGWETPDENPFTKLPYSFTELIDYFAEYLSLPQEDSRNRDNRDNPFYY
jgi:hypothetical protein